MSKIENIANELDKCDKETLKNVANAFARLQRWVVVPYDQLYNNKHQSVQTVEEVKTSFKVVLSGYDASKKINLIRVVREITGFGLIESKAAVEKSPTIIKENISNDDAEKIKKYLEESGGTVDIQ